ncbi:MAG: nitrile hydratase subunit beta [Candidatus Rokubacteria bacterium]|nr:nitrile hydratase subunit beta [Candidatus Rokubacteria bacterium]
MNGAHDLGGMHGFGPVDPEPNEPVFHSEWERRAFAVTLSTGFLGKWNIDQSRFARELMPPAEYLATSYYEHWLWGLEHLLVQQGLLTPEEIEARVAALRNGETPPVPAPWTPSSAGRVVRPGDVEKLLSTGNPFRVDEDIPPRFKAGDAVLTHNTHPRGHTRLPRYARGRRGVIDRDHGVFVFPDAHAEGLGKKPQHCYSVRFEARELWGPDAPANERIHIDLWDDYLEPA